MGKHVHNIDTHHENLSDADVSDSENENVEHGHDVNYSKPFKSPIANPISQKKVPSPPEKNKKNQLGNDSDAVNLPPTPNTEVTMTPKGKKSSNKERVDRLKTKSDDLIRGAAASESETEDVNWPDVTHSQSSQSSMTSKSLQSRTGRNSGTMASWYNPNTPGVNTANNSAATTPAVNNTISKSSNKNPRNSRKNKTYTDDLDYA